MPIECGIRIKDLTLAEFADGSRSSFDDSEKAQIKDLMAESILKQYQISRDLENTAYSKSFGDQEKADTSKGIEAYCTWKGYGDSPEVFTKDLAIEDDEENKAWGAVARIAAGALASRVSCGVRIKDFVIDQDEATFKIYMNDAIDTFVDQLDSMVINSFASSSKAFDAQDKTVEVYCEIKSFCGG